MPTSAGKIQIHCHIIQLSWTNAFPLICKNKFRSKQRREVLKKLIYEWLDHLVIRKRKEKQIRGCEDYIYNRSDNKDLPLN